MARNLNNIGKWENTGEIITIATPYIVAVEKERKIDMRYLYEVFIIDPEEDNVLFRGHVIAKDRNGAERKVVAGTELEGDLDDYDFIVNKLGEVRPKKEVQEVKILE